MIFGIAAKTGSRLFPKYDFINKERFAFSAAVLMSLVGVGLSVFSTNKLFVASSSTSTTSRSLFIKSKSSIDL